MQHKDFVFILGPCSLENAKTSFEVAEEVKQLSLRHSGYRFYFKGSFDKANRSSLNSSRGPGIDEGLEILDTVKRNYQIPVCTDFHTAEQASILSEVVDVLQVPAFLCRQTDLLVAAAKTGKIVSVKKGQFLSPGEMKYVVDKLEMSNAVEIWQVERGTTFGYQNLVVDMRSFQIMEAFGHRTIFDATHSVQMPGAGNGITIGKREFIPRLAFAAIAAGCGGLFMESHPDPDQAISDGPNQVHLKDLAQLVDSCVALHKVTQSLGMTR